MTTWQGTGQTDVGLAHHPRFRPNTLYYSPIWLLEIC